ncbi:DUF805 domain-containing protein [Hyunsoonleella flava]|uniref:DUF805 domain-containing protein n=1 Tax=Hyunsoonleella flava TaxID=2527939 RepID=UPI001F322AB7|nr:DUF805 domain-containing protein [Hyunsoonleella flava]
MHNKRKGVLKWYLTVLIDNYANFSGRARREEYWMYVLFWFLTVFAINLLSYVLSDFIDIGWFPMIIGVFALATLIPWLAVNVRRLHDQGKSGGYFFINFIPIVGRIWYLVLMCTDGEYGANRYGPDPKNPEINDEIDDIGKPLLD